jgi:hypothetical protein
VEALHAQPYPAPADVFVSAYFGYKKPQKTVNAFQMLSEFPGGIIGLN